MNTKILDLKSKMKTVLFCKNYLLIKHVISFITTVLNIKKKLNCAKNLLTVLF